MSKKCVAAAILASTLLTPACARFPDWFGNLFRPAPINYGAWQCTACYIPDASISLDSAAPIDINNFIRVANNEIHAGEKIQRWIPDSNITVCNLQNCMEVFYVAATSLFLPKKSGFARPANLKVKIPSAQYSGTRGFVVTPLGPAPNPLSGVWSIYIPYVLPRWITPSVTIIQDSISTTYIGVAEQLPIQLETNIGNSLSWDFNLTEGLRDINLGYWACVNCSPP